MGHVVPAKSRDNGWSRFSFPVASARLETFGFKFSAGGANISRTMMMKELGVVLATVPRGSAVEDYREAILQQNVLGKTTDSTPQKSLRHLRELYALDEGTPIFSLLRQLTTSIQFGKVQYERGARYAYVARGVAYE